MSAPWSGNREVERPDQDESVSMKEEATMEFR
jgi:hypothetical protein